MFFNQPNRSFADITSIYLEAVGAKSFEDREETVSYTAAKVENVAGVEVLFSKTFVPTECRPIIDLAIVGVVALVKRFSHFFILGVIIWS